MALEVLGAYPCIELFVRYFLEMIKYSISHLPFLFILGFLLLFRGSGVYFIALGIIGGIGANIVQGTIGKIAYIGGFTKFAYWIFGFTSASLVTSIVLFFMILSRPIPWYYKVLSIFPISIFIGAFDSLSIFILGTGHLTISLFLLEDRFAKILCGTVSIFFIIWLALVLSSDVTGFTGVFARIMDWPCGLLNDALSKIESLRETGAIAYLFQNILDFF